MPPPPPLWSMLGPVRTGGNAACIPGGFQAQSLDLPLPWPSGQGTVSRRFLWNDDLVMQEWPGPQRRGPRGRRSLWSGRWVWCCCLRSSDWSTLCMGLEGLCCLKSDRDKRVQPHFVAVSEQTHRKKDQIFCGSRDGDWGNG